jgi:hypothetical protein
MVAAYSIGGMHHAYLEKTIEHHRRITFSDPQSKITNPTQMVQLPKMFPLNKIN